MMVPVAYADGSRPGRGPAPGPGRARRAFVYAFLGALLTTAALGVEAWPFTGWRLFSGVRTGTTAGWRVVTVGPDGGETPVAFAALGRGYRGAAWRLADFPALERAEREAVCRAWADAVAARTGSPVVAVRAYRTRRPVPTGPGPRPPAVATLRYECARR